MLPLLSFPPRSLTPKILNALLGCRRLPLSPALRSCQARDCRGLVTSRDWMLPKVQEK
jgi:hypothetical protein